VKFDEAVDGFGAAVVGAAGVEVAEELAAPLSRSPTSTTTFTPSTASIRRRTSNGSIHTDPAPSSPPDVAFGASRAMIPVSRHSTLTMARPRNAADLMDPDGVLL
jgi:hypothetical protein